jgi:hypothetical protein
VALNEINTALSHTPNDAPAAPASCTAELARKMDASEMHTVMVAGLAGGIGLCGGACGALGAAIWLSALKDLRAGTGKVEFKNPAAQETITRFVQSSNFEFKCAKIVGRKFENVGDHAAYVHKGGCAKIIDALAGSCRRSS